MMRGGVYERGSCAGLWGRHLRKVTPAAGAPGFAGVHRSEGSAETPGSNSLLRAQPPLRAGDAVANTRQRQPAPHRPPYWEGRAEH